MCVKASPGLAVTVHHDAMCSRLIKPRPELVTQNEKIGFGQSETLSLYAAIHTGLVQVTSYNNGVINTDSQPQAGQYRTAKLLKQALSSHSRIFMMHKLPLVCISKKSFHTLIKEMNILNKGKATRRSFNLIQTQDDSLDNASHTEQGIDLLFSCVE